ncbi:MAG: hypothetical protein Faunusvirus5_18 [Faunusvirus sp.]|jgi:hypothetical protein|uniref:Uncharacterized protein n=1 Tax=Faunusvirus sp. TaxID=2487766 RepID=A0A3G5A133_9VIRU|nr:MAG: hypothetical protein Faunusvirus5_18 [Faunusvirus sp.]
MSNHQNNDISQYNDLLTLMHNYSISTDENIENECVRFINDNKNCYKTNTNHILLVAIVRGFNTVAGVIINETDLDTLNKHANSSCTLLQTACYYSESVIAHALIDRGVNLDTQTAITEAAILTACKRGMIDVALKIFDKGCDLSVVDYNGNDIYDCCNTYVYSVAQKRKYYTACNISKEIGGHIRNRYIKCLSQTVDHNFDNIIYTKYLIDEICSYII